MPFLFFLWAEPPEEFVARSWSRIVMEMEKCKSWFGLFDSGGWVHKGGWMGCME